MERDTAPQPMVLAPGTPRRRAGRGFSLGELVRVGLTIRQALRLKIPVDIRRRSVHDSNIETLRQIVQPTPPKKRARRKKAEEHVVVKKRGRRAEGAEKPKAPRRGQRKKRTEETRGEQP